MTIQTQNRTRESRQLQCSCGNNRRFIQVIRRQLNEVDAKANHIHLLESEIDRYVCPECAEEVRLESAHA
jgi:hypothetical protein